MHVATKSTLGRKREVLTLSQKEMKALRDALAVAEKIREVFPDDDDMEHPVNHAAALIECGIGELLSLEDNGFFGHPNEFLV